MDTEYPSNSKKQPEAFSQHNKQCYRNKIPNRIYLKHSELDGGVLFCVPSQINFFLKCLFDQYADKNGLLSELQFSLMLLDSGIFSRTLKPIKSEKENKKKNTIQQDKIVHAVFRHRDNISGDPIDFSQFVRVLHRVARLKFRFLNLKDDKELNALIACLARSGICTAHASKDREVLTDMKQESLIKNTSISPKVYNVQKASAIYYSNECPRIAHPSNSLKQRLLPDAPKTLKKKLLPKHSQNSASKTVEKKKKVFCSRTPIKETYISPYIETVLTSTNNLESPFLEKNKTEEEASEKRSETEQLSSSLNQDYQKEEEWLEKKTYELFRSFSDDKRDGIPRISLEPFQDLLLLSLTPEVVTLDDGVDLYFSFTKFDKKISLTSPQNLDFFKFKMILQYLGNLLYPYLHIDESTYRIVRNYILPCLYHSDHYEPLIKKNNNVQFNQNLYNPDLLTKTNNDDDSTMFSNSHEKNTNQHYSYPPSFNTLCITNNQQQTKETVKEDKDTNVLNNTKKQNTSVPLLSSNKTKNEIEKNLMHKVFKAKTSPYAISYNGYVLTDQKNKHNKILQEYTSGPDRTIIGPDGRPLANAYLGSDGRQIKVLLTSNEITDELMKMKTDIAMKYPPLYLNNFEVSYETSSSSSSVEEEEDLHYTYVEKNDFPLLELSELKKGNDANLQGCVFPVMKTLVHDGISTPRFE